MSILTGRQQQVLDWIRGQIEATGRPPTRAEIAAALGFRSVNAAEEHVRALARKGMIILASGSARGIRLPDRHAEGIPVIGHVAAGQPLLAQAHVTAYHRIDPALFRPRADYFLIVVGESMRDAGIRDGDLLAVHKTPAAQDGQIVVARRDDEVTVKRLRYRAGRVALLPENPDYQPIVPRDHEDWAIEGVGVGVLRQGLEGMS
ncbi:transcriptional repressor LexA [Acidiferrobacter sp.]|uniref:transcriptional repressor LexA n=1 Tax=Acidiferrobacter sp. TaxID=1872107 RepID=UPI002639D90C|nr:transcriptional repressor LexA [Acidiferrobacter sp.]